LPIDAARMMRWTFAADGRAALAGRVDVIIVDVPRGGCG
jgi:hypothetical protein